MSASHNSSGVVQFPVDGAPRSFRFTIVVNDNKLRIWIEDTTTKEQWQTTAMDIQDFVTVNTALVQAQAKDYAMLILECLAPTKGDTDKPTTKSLSRPVADGSRVLCVGFSMQTLTFMTALEYSFTLSSIKLEATDLLASRMRDLEATVKYLVEENAQLKRTLDASVDEENTSRVACEQALLALKEEQASRLALEERLPLVQDKPLQYVRATSTGSAISGHKLVWTRDATGDKVNTVVTFLPNGHIVLPTAGVYEFMLMVMHKPMGGDSIKLMHNARELACGAVANCEYGVVVTAPIHYVFSAVGKEELHVLFTGKAWGNISGSYITIMKR